MKISIRPTRPDEVKILCELDVQIFENNAFDAPELWENLETFFILADKFIVGSIALRHNTGMADHYDYEYLPETGSIYIVSIGLLPAWQDRKIGKQGMQWIIAYARKNNFTRIVSNVRASNIRSILLHQGAGFRISQLIPEYYEEPKEDTVVLELKLDGAQ
ncbi:MAG TPA: GNAT family N-acetyltransferase [Candidatus Paceibacterota bacterium]